jgi:hypothetical protein
MARKGLTKVIYKGTFISKQSLGEAIGTLWDPLCKLKPYLFAHPNPISAIISWITSWQIIPYKTERWL